MKSVCSQQDHARRDAVIPNPRLKSMDQVREVLRLRHYSIRTETTYCDWIRRYIRFHKMSKREELNEAEGKIELFLSDLAVNGKVAVSTHHASLDLKLQIWN